MLMMHSHIPIKGKALIMYNVLDPDILDMPIAILFIFTIFSNVFCSVAEDTEFSLQS